MNNKTVIPAFVLTNLLMHLLLWNLFLWFSIVPNSYAIIGISLAVTSFAFYRFLDCSPKTITYLSLGLILFTACFGFLLSLVHDYSYDGQGYHQEAIKRIADGWNFVRNPTIPLGTGFYGIIYYPRGIWVLYSVWVNAAANFEAAKIFSLLCIVSSFFLFIDFASQFKVRFKYVLATLVCFNPIVISELLTFCVDGILSLLLLSMMLSGLLYLKSKQPVYWIVFLCSGILLANSKFTGLVFFACACFCLGLYLLVQKDWRSVRLKLTLPFIILFLAVSYNPYFTNYASKGHPLYPVFSSKGKVDSAATISSQVSKEFYGLNRFQKTFYTTFGKTSGLILNKPELKFPFTFSLKEISEFSDSGPRSGAFGPLFGGIFLLILVLIILTFSLLKKRTVLSGVIAALLLLVFVSPECWWPRLNPQLYFLALGLFIIADLTFEGGKKNLLYKRLILFLLLLNSALILVGMTTGQVARERKLHQTLVLLTKHKIHHLNIISPFPYSHLIMLKEFGFSYSEIKGENCQNITSSLYTHAEICIDDFSEDVKKDLIEINARDFNKELKMLFTDR